MKSVAIIGGAGFIGKYLSEELIDKGYQVKIIDVQKPLLDVPFEKVDILNDINGLTSSLKDVEGVIHLAAIVGVDKCLENESQVLQVNLQGTINIIKACELNGIKRLLFSSSSEVYGDGIKVPFAENDEKVPKSVYGKSKLLAEETLRLKADSNFIIRVVRFFNVYGTGQSTHFVIPKFVNKFIKGEDIPIYGDGSQVRCFTHVKDAVRGTLLAFEYEGDVYEDFNIGNSRPITIMELVEILKKKIPTASSIIHENLGQNGIRPSHIEIYKRIPDTIKAERLLGFKAAISIEEGIKHYLSNM